MADKKYIGKPGKQDDPCWKGYEMIGMKKKGAKTVPNCVPVKEMAQEIIEKAKARTKQGFPEEGDYGYHPNPGLPPQESDSDEDMDKAYKIANEKEAMKPLNAKTLEVSNKVEEGWIVKKGTEVVSTHKTKDEADVKAMKHPLYKVYAKEEVELEEGWGVKAHSFSSFKDGVQDWADNHTHNGKVDVKTHVVNAGGKKWHQTTASHKGVIVGTFNHTGNGKSEEGHGRHAHWSDNVHEELEEAYGMWKVDFPKQHAGKPVAAGSVHVKAQNTAHAHKVAAKRVGVDHKVFKTKVTKSSILPEEVEEIMERGEDKKGYYRATEDGAGLTRKGAKAMGIKTAVTTPPSKLDPDGKAAKRRKSFCARMSGMKGPMKDEKGRPTRKAMSLRRWNCRTEETQLDEVLGKDNEWGRPELRKKFAAMTPGQEGMAADKIPTFDPRYDDVTTQHLGLHPVREGYLAEISARGAVARAKFQARVHKVLNDPASIKRAKKVVAKQKAAAKEKEAPHLVMQLRKAVSIGSKVHFQDGSHHQIAPNHADIFMSKYNSAKSSIEKEALQKRAHKSHAEFMKTIAEEVLGEVYSVHVKGIDKSPQFNDHVKGWGGEHHYTSDKGVAYKFKKEYQATGFHHGIKAGFRHLDSEYDGKVNEEVHENCGTPDCCMQCDTAAMGTHHVDSYEAHKGSGDQISPVISHDDDDIRFSDFNEEEIEKELEAEVHALTWDDIVDLYDDDELEYVDNPEMEEGEEEIEEAITPAGRLKKKFAAMRTKTRRNMARNLAIKRVSTPDRIKARSIRAARRMVYKRLLRNRDISTVSAAEKTRLEAQIKRMAPMVARLSVRIAPKVRKLEQSRIQRGRAKKK